MNSIRRVSIYLFRYKWLFVLTLTLAVTSTLLYIVIPKIIRWTFDTFILNGDTNMLCYCVAIIAGCYLGKEFFNSLRIRVNNTLEQKVLIDLRRDIHSKLLELPVTFYDQNKSGSVASRATEDVESVERALLDGTEQGTVAILTLVFIAGILFYEQTLLATFVCLPLPILLIMGISHSKITRKNWRAVRESAGDLNALLVEDIQGNRLIHSFAIKNREKKRFMNKAYELRDRTLKAMFRWAIYGPSANFVANLGIVSVVGIGGYLIISDPENFKYGDFIMFFLYASMLYEPTSKLHALNHLLAAGKASGDRVFEVIDHPVDIKSPDEPKSVPDGSLSIDFNNVDFNYHERAQVLKNFNLEMKAGEVTALVGHTGAGKSTVANLLMRYYDVSSGSVRINDIDVRDFDLEDLRGNIGYVAQDPFLFEGSIRDNLVLANEGSTEAEQIDALQKACAWDFVERLPDGLDTNIGEKGIKLSQGEKQRITIARVLLKNPAIIVLDEATASVDTITEAAIQEGLNILMQNRTVLIIAHRLSTVRSANNIIVLEKGEIRESGTHDELLSQKGHYADLWSRQADIIPS